MSTTNDTTDEAAAPPAARQLSHARVTINGEPDRVTYRDEPDRVAYHPSRGEADAAQARAELTARITELCRIHGGAKVTQAVNAATSGRTGLLEPLGLQDLVGKPGSLGMCAALANKLAREEQAAKDLAREERAARDAEVRRAQHEEHRQQIRAQRAARGDTPA